MNEDIGPILEHWPYGEDANVRKIVGTDGAEKQAQTTGVAVRLHREVSLDSE